MNMLIGAVKCLIGSLSSRWIATGAEFQFGVMQVKDIDWSDYFGSVS